MQFSCTKLALCLTALALAQSLPEVDVVQPFDQVPNVVQEEFALVDETNQRIFAIGNHHANAQTNQRNHHANAKKKVAAMLETGKDDNACRELAKATSDTVTADVATQQKTLDAMPTGSECADEGQDLITDAKEALRETEETKTAKTKALALVNSKKIDFGEFQYDQLAEGKCGSFFNQKVWKDAKAAVATATQELASAAAAVTPAKKAVETAEAAAANLVTECQCKAKTLIDKTLETMNAGAQSANTKAWNEGAHMLCFLDGKSEDSCSVPALPVVKPVKLSDQVLGACYYTKTWSDPKVTTGGKVQSGRKFTLFQMQTANFAVGESRNYESDKYAKVCTDAGLLPVGCGSSPYDCAKDFQGGGKCISMPQSWSCNVNLHSASNPAKMQNPMYLCDGKGQGSACGSTPTGKAVLYGAGATGSGGYQGGSFNAICGKYND